jgi:hypothetical protein
MYAVRLTNAGRARCDEYVHDRPAEELFLFDYANIQDLLPGDFM